MFFVQLLDDFLGIGKHAGVPLERTVFRIPSGGTESSSEINECVAGQFLFAERFCFGDDFFAASECAVGLLIAKAPQRWHLSVTGEARVFGHDHCGLTSGDEKDVEGKCSVRAYRQELAFSACEVKCAKGLMKVHGPSGRPNEPRDGDTPAVRRQLVAALATNHAIRGTATVELRTALAES